MTAALLLLWAAAPASAARTVAVKAPRAIRLAPFAAPGLGLGAVSPSLSGPTLLSFSPSAIPALDLAKTLPAMQTIPAAASLPAAALPASTLPHRARAARADPAPAKKQGALPALRAMEKAARGAKSRETARSFAMAFDGNAADGGQSQEGVLSYGAELDSYRVSPSKRRALSLAEFDPDATGEFDKDKKSKKKALKQLKKETARLQALQQRLYAEGKRSVLVVFQAPDTGGKDGTIRWVLGPLNPQGVRVSSFKKPTAEEARRHYLWRIKKELPKPGMMRVFNRSHFEDILVPSVLKTHEAAVIEGRYEEINAFEKKLAQSGVTVLKFFLNISKDEQKRRLQARIDDPEKNWKFDKGDLESRALWEKYHGVYEKMLARTSKAWAPWFVIPANHKWYRSLAVARILRKTMEAMDPRFPPPAEGLKDIVIPD